MTAAFRSIIVKNLIRYPRAEIQDIYKLVHQAALGSEHAVHNVETAREWLLRELEELRANPFEPLIDPISESGEIVRVHLWPYLQTGKDPEQLLQGFVKTANEYRGSPETLRQYGVVLVQMAEEGELPFPPEGVQGFFAKMDSDGFPAVHHSESYEDAYHPSYRVVAMEYLPRDMGA